jgi:hypothetical protein
MLDYLMAPLPSTTLHFEQPRLSTTTGEVRPANQPLPLTLPLTSPLYHYRRGQPLYHYRRGHPHAHRAQPNQSQPYP